MFALRETWRDTMSGYRRFTMLAAMLCVEAAAASAQEVTFPPRRPGLWSVQTITERPEGGPKINARMCIDAATDRDLMDFGLRMSKDTCKRYDVKQGGKTWTIDAECSFGPVKSVTRTRVSGDFQAGVTVRIEGTTEGMPIGGAKGPQETRMTQEARWVSPGCEGLEPGDVAMDGGMKINVKQMKQLKKLLPGLQIR